MATIVGMAVGGWLSGAIYDLAGSYQAAFLHGIAWNLLNMSIAFWLLLGRLRPHEQRTSALRAPARRWLPTNRPNLSIAIGTPSLPVARRKAHASIASRLQAQLRSAR
jgi:hypothetical protein